MPNFATISASGRKSVLFGVLLAGQIAFAARAEGGAPLEQIKSGVERATAVLNDSKLSSESKKSELRRALYPKFDFTEMAKRSLGSHWQRRTPEEQKEFVKLFTELIESSYMSNLDAYQGEKVVIAGEKQEQDVAQVDTKIITKKGEEFMVNYRLHQAGGDWKIYDVIIENISLVNNYRSQFNRIIANNSYEELVRRLRDKSQFAATKEKHVPHSCTGVDCRH